MRRVSPRPENTNKRGYYIEVRDIQYRPWDYLIIFRPVWMFGSELVPWRGEAYYMGLVTLPENLVPAVEAANELFCEDDIRRSNSDWWPELFIPFPLTEYDGMYYTFKYGSKENDKTEQERVDYLLSEFASFPTDPYLEPTPFERTLERWTTRWTLS